MRRQPAWPTSHGASRPAQRTVQEAAEAGGRGGARGRGAARQPLPVPARQRHRTGHVLAEGGGAVAGAAGWHTHRRRLCEHHLQGGHAGGARRCARAQHGGAPPVQGHRGQRPVRKHALVRQAAPALGCGRVTARAGASRAAGSVAAWAGQVQPGRALQLASMHGCTRPAARTCQRLAAVASHAAAPLHDGAAPPTGQHGRAAAAGRPASTLHQRGAPAAAALCTLRRGRQQGAHALVAAEACRIKGGRCPSAAPAPDCNPTPLAARPLARAPSPPACEARM